MRKIRLKIFVIVSLLLITSVGLFVKSSSTSRYEPVLMKYVDLPGSIKFLSPVKIIKPGKIYYKDKYIFISERYKGIHIIDNNDPYNPLNIGFINVPGCLDIAIKDSILYTDNAVDLIAIDLSKLPDSIYVTKRLQRVLPEPLPPDGSPIPTEFQPARRPKNTVIVEWRQIY